MTAALFGPQPVAPRRWTERDLLDLVRERYSKVHPGNGPRYVVAEHVRNQCGFGGYDPEHRMTTGRQTTLRTADAIAVDLWPSSGNLLHGFEVKVSRSDWLTELKDPSKAEAFKPYCDHWWLVVPDADIVHDDLPEGWGLLVAHKVPSAGFDAPVTYRLRQRRAAPRLDRREMPFGMVAALLRAAVKTATLPAPTEERPAAEGGGV